MRKRIDTLTYSTDTAKKLGDYYNDVPRESDSFLHEALYKKRTGEYFLYGESGAFGKYAGNFEGSMVGGQDIKPLSFSEAKKWYRQAMNDDEKFAPLEVYEKEFESENDKIATTVHLHKKTKVKLERMALKWGISQSDVLEKLIRKAK